MNRVLRVRAFALALVLAVAPSLVNRALAQPTAGPRVLFASDAAAPVPSIPPYLLPSPVQTPIPEGIGFDPLIERPFAPLSGWYTYVETSLLVVHLRNQLQSTVSVSGRTDAFDQNIVPGSPLRSAVSPKFEFGYRLSEGDGEVGVAYRFLTTQGSGITATDLGPAAHFGHLDLNTIDLVYNSREYSLGDFPGDKWDFRWTVGVRLAQLDFSNRLVYGTPTDGAPVDAVLERRTVNTFTGVGPMAVLNLQRRLPGVLPGLAFGGRFEAGDTFGRINQQFYEQINGAAATGPLLGVTSKKFEVAVLSLNARLGASYTLPTRNFSSFFVGYQYETYFQAGRLDNSRAQLDLSGVVFRFEFNF